MSKSKANETGLRKVSVLLQVPGTLKMKSASRRPVVERKFAMENALEPLSRVAAIDPDFGALPMGRGNENFIALEAATIERSDHVVIKADIELESDEPIPEFMGEDVEVFSNPEIATTLGCMNDPAIGTVQDAMVGLDFNSLRERGLNGKGVAIAIVDGGINRKFLEKSLGRLINFDTVNSWAPQDSAIIPGNAHKGHGTMCAYAALTMAPEASIVDIAILNNSTSGGSKISGTIGTAMSAYTHINNSWVINFSPGGLHKYKGLVINNSWAIYDERWDFPAGHRGRIIDNPRHAFNQFLRLMNEMGADIIFPSGNCGHGCPDRRCSQNGNEIMAMNASPYVLTVAGCDINKNIAGFSSQGPGISGLAAQKPDITAFTHFLGSKVKSGSHPDTGTSTACPLVAGTIAAIRSKASFEKIVPLKLFDEIRESAEGAPTAGWTKDFGHGIIAPAKLADRLGL